MAKQILCWDEAWEISKLESFAWDNTLNILPKFPPATIHSELCNVSKESSDRELIPLIQPLWRNAPWISVPG